MDPPPTPFPPNYRLNPPIDLYGFSHPVAFIQ